MTGLEQALTQQQLSLVTFLACVGPARRASLIEALWGGQPISDARFANLISELRRAIGRDRLPVMAAGHYRLVGVATDLDLLQARCQGGPSDGDRIGDAWAAPDASELPEVQPRSTEAELAALESAMGLVAGPVFGTPPDRSWWWLDGRPEVVASAEAAVAQIATRLVTILWEQGRLDRAREVCQHALSCCPLDRELVLALERLHRAQGRPAAANRLIASWRVQVHRLTGEDPRPPLDQASIGTAVTTTLPR